MKRPTAIILILLVLATVIGLEYFRGSLRFIISDDRTTWEREAVEFTSCPDLESEETGKRLQDFSASDAPSLGAHYLETDLSTRARGDSEPYVIELSVTGELSRLHYIRSLGIVGNSKLTKAQINRLRLSVNTVAEALQPHVIVFDADAVSTSEAPVLLFAKDGLDLTSQVKAVYKKLENEVDRFSETVDVE